MSRDSPATSPPPVPPLPLAPIVASSFSASSSTYLQRIFIVSSKKYTNVEMDDTMTAGEVVDLVYGRGELPEEDTASPRGWMLWELANDYGMGELLFVSQHLASIDYIPRASNSCF
jgi:phosphosulfolactate phosphohydrolase-like enzyme